MRIGFSGLRLRVITPLNFTANVLDAIACRLSVRPSIRPSVCLLVTLVDHDHMTTYVLLIHQRHRQTDRQTDDMQWQYIALHYHASRGKN